MKVICLDNYVETTVGTNSDMKWPYLTVGASYEYEDHPTRTDFIRIKGDKNICAYYPRKQFTDIAECRDKALIKILE
jgi:hypothetical protein